MKKIFLLLMLLAWTRLLFAQEVQWEDSERPLMLDFKTAMRMALERNVDMILAEERIREAVARIGEAASPLLPQFSLSSSQARETRNLLANGIKLPQQSSLVGPFNSFDARLTLTQTLFDWAAVERLRAARAGKKLTAAQKKKVRQDVMALAASLYIDAKRAQENLRVGQAFYLRDREKWELVKSKLGLGTASEVEAAQAKRDFRQSRHLLEQYRAKAVETSMDLKSALGLPPRKEILFMKKEKVVDYYRPENEEALDAAERNPDVEAAREQVNLDKAQKRIEAAEFLPKVTGFADYGSSGSTPPPSEPTYTLGAKVAWPLFEGGKKFFRIRAAKSKLKQSEAQLKDVHNQAQSKTLTALENIKQAQSFVNFKNAEFDYREKEWELARRKLASGTGSQIEVIEAFAAKTLAQDERSESAALYLLAQINLAHATGQIDDFLKTTVGNQHG